VPQAPVLSALPVEVLEMTNTVDAVGVFTARLEILFLIHLHRQKKDSLRLLKESPFKIEKRGVSPLSHSLRQDPQLD
jgi:hypothetical protein